MCIAVRVSKHALLVSLVLDRQQSEERRCSHQGFGISMLWAVRGESPGMATCNREAGFAIKEASDASWKGVEK
jgi:hypothetical protein